MSDYARRRKHAFMKEFRTTEGDTGSPEVQVAILSLAHRKTSRPVCTSNTLQRKTTHGACLLKNTVATRRKLLDYVQR